MALVFAVLGSAAFLFALDTILWHSLPLGFEGTLVYGGGAFWLGGISTVIAGVTFARSIRIDSAKRLSARIAAAYCAALFAGYIALFIFGS